MERSRKTKRERFTTDDAKYFRRWADDVIAELKRAMRRREFFRHWAPKEDV